jgi:hypothetical protein
MSKLIYTGRELSVHNPELVEEWDYDKNFPITPDDVSCGSAKKYWWKCPKCGKSYEASPNKRTCRKTACPYCAAIDRGAHQKETYAKRNNFAKKYPEIAKEWNYEKNAKSPSDYSCSSNEVVWWKCKKCGNEWQTSPSKRTCKKGTGCPLCASKQRGKNSSLKAALANSFVENYPEIAKEWDDDKNIGLNINEYSSKSNIKVWWKCSFCGNSWQATINKRTTGRGCPNCSIAGTSFSEQAVLFYVKKLFSDTVSRYNGFGMELDIYIPSIKTAIEYDGIYYHNSKRAIEKENKKDELCKENDIQLIRIRDPKLPDTKDAVRIDCKDIQGKHLNSAIAELLKYLDSNNNTDVNIEKDAIAIKSKFRQILSENSIAKKHPELLCEWDYDKNGNISPESITVGAKIKLWWKCKNCGYSWQADPSHRIRGRGCPLCSNKVVMPGINDMASHYPKLALQWYYEKNYPKKPNQVSCGSQKSVWWKCEKGHEWQASPYTRIKGGGCPVCSNKKVLKGYNDLLSKCPELAKEWNYNKNKLNPDEVVYCSEKKAWWKCNTCGYEWESIISSRYYGRGCPECAKIKRGKTRSENYAKKNNFELNYPELAKQWHPTKNGDLLPSMVSNSSNKKVWWLCPICGNEWQATINTRTSGCGCAVCAGRKVKVGFNDLATTNPKLAEQWHPTKNGNITPQDVTRGSHKRVWWLCKECKNEWEATVHDRSSGRGCPKCAKEKRKNN